MKNTLILFIILLQQWVVTAQNSTVSEPFHYFSMYQTTYLGQKEDHLYYYKKVYDKTIRRNRIYYYQTNSKSTENKKPILIKNDEDMEKRDHTSFIGLYQYDDNLIECYEVLRDGTTGYGFRKRNLNEITEVSDLMYINEAGFRAIKQDENGIYFLTDKKLFHLTYELEIAWVSTIDFLSNQNLKTLQFNTDNNHNFIITCAISRDNSQQFQVGKEPLNSSMLFIIVDSLGQTTCINPKIGKDVFYRYSNFQYDNKNEELSGVIITSQMLSEKYDKNVGMGYSYHRWAITGEIIDHEFQIIPFEKFVTEQFKEYAKKVRFNYATYKFPYIDLENKCTVEFLPNGQIVLIINNLERANDHIFHSKCFIALDGSGKLSWTTLMPFNQDGVYRPFQYLITENEIHCFMLNPNKFFVNNEYSYQNARSPRGDNSRVAVKQTIQLSDGTVSVKKIQLELSDRMIPRQIASVNPKQVIIKYSSSSNIAEQILTLSTE